MHVLKGEKDESLSLSAPGTTAVDGDVGAGREEGFLRAGICANQSAMTSPVLPIFRAYFTVQQPPDFTCSVVPQW